MVMEKKKRPLYEMTLDEVNERSGVFAISIVDNPAIQANFVALSQSKNHTVHFKTIDNEKRIILGPALIPDKPIYQVIDGQDVDIHFSAQTIRTASQLFLKRGHQNSTNIDHAISVNGLSVVESWIKEDDKHDKSVAFGLSEPVGTWYVSMKVDNDDIWQEYIKTGVIKGFSIEGNFRPVEVKASTPKGPIEQIMKIIQEYQNQTAKS